MRTAAETCSSWKELSEFTSLADLKVAACATDHPSGAVTGLRSAFLLFQNLDRTTWPARLTDSRSAYESLRSHFLRSIEHPDEIDLEVDPLSEHSESPWIALREDETIRSEIFQDVERCMPDSVYFRQPATQKMLLDILFIYSPVLWAIERDAVNVSSAEEGEDDLLLSLLDSSYIEHDTFTLFALIMQSAKSYYEPGTENGPIGQQNSAASGVTLPNKSPILVRCTRIFELILPSVDPELASHLQSLDLAPQIFLMRWIRLLFGREFPFDDVLRIWDALFALDPSLELINYICVAMLIRQRWKLVQADLNDALALLLRYPSPAPHTPVAFVSDAIALKKNCDQETGRELISKYSGKAPKSRPETISTLRRSSQQQGPSSHPQNSPFIASASLPFEALLSDAARVVLSRSEKWGFNQVVRDAFGEVRRNVQSLQTGRNSPQSKPVIENTRSRPPVRTTRRQDASSTIAANLLRKLNALETRNKRLADMLDAAVADLWDFQKEASDKAGSEISKDALTALSVAVAKAQFVQVYLSDPGLSLDEHHSDTTSPSAQKADLAAQSSSAGASASATKPQTSPDQQPKTLPSPPNPSQEAQQPPPSAPIHHQAPTHTKSLSTSSNSSRPSLAQSSFSWMLGQAHEGPFTTASPFSPGEKRRNPLAARDKAFLFGDDDDAAAQDAAEVVDLADAGAAGPRAPPAGERSATKLGRRKKAERIGLGDLPSGDASGSNDN